MPHGTPSSTPGHIRHGFVPSKALGQLHDVIGRMPESIILDTRDDEPEVVYTYEGETPGDRPDVETLLAEVDALRESFVFDYVLVDC